jgi:hypothetical protein
MKWTEPKPPTPNQSNYDHVFSETPLGKMRIEWKSWKKEPSYDLEINDEWILCVYNLEEAKEEALNYIKNKYNELKKFLEEKET